jgi:uncharacterized damage-inducible protein DinB
MSLLVEQFQALARYNAWMNERLYALCATLGDEERRRDRGAFFRSIHGTLNHILLADRAWLGRFTGDAAVARSLDAAGNPIEVRGLDHELYADFDHLRRERARTDADVERFVAGLTEERLAASFKYKSAAGLRFEHPLWQAVTHFFNHQTHHRGQVTTLLFQAGRDPGVTDFAVLVRGDAK